LTNGEYNGIMPEEIDIEQYLEKMKKRWQSALLSEEQNQQISDSFDYRIERDDAQGQELSSDEDQ
jgi:hypothetical protein